MKTIEAFYNYFSFGPSISVDGPGQWADAWDKITVTVPEPLKAWENIMDWPMIEFPGGEAYPFKDVVTVKDGSIYIAFPNATGKHWQYKVEYQIKAELIRFFVDCFRGACYAYHVKA